MIYNNINFIMYFLLLNLYLGAITFFTGAITLLLIMKNIIKSKLKIIFLIVLQFIFSFIISLIIWRLWIFPFDIMIACFSLPATLAEIIVTSTIYTLYIINRRKS